jgi:hypothetical protein
MLMTVLLVDLVEYNGCDGEPEGEEPGLYFVARDAMRNAHEQRKYILNYVIRVSAALRPYRCTRFEFPTPSRRFTVLGQSLCQVSTFNVQL